MGGSSNTSTQTTSAGPWPPTQKHLKNILGEAKDLFKSGSGFQAYGTGDPNKKGWVPFSSETEDALSQITQMARGGNPFYGGASDFTQGLIGGDYNLDQSGFMSLLGQNPNAIQQNASGIASGAQGINVNPQLAALLGQNQNALQNFGSDIASGATSAGGGINPQLAALLGLDANALAQNAGGISSGARNISGSINPQLQALMGQTPSAIGQNAGGIASGADRLGTEGDYRSLFDAVDPDFEKVVGKTANDLGDQISRQFGGASFGSAAHTGTVTDQVGDVVSRMRSDNFARNQGMKQGLLGDITGVQGANLANRLNASTALSGEQGAAQAARAGLLNQMGGFSDRDIQNQLSASSALSGEQMGNRAQQSSILGQMGGLSLADIQNRLGAASALSGEQGQNRAAQSGILGQMGGFQGQNIGNQLNASGMLSGEQQNAFNNSRGLFGDMANLSQQDIQNRLAGLGMADSVYNSQYLPAQMMAGVGAAREGKDKEILQAKMDKHAINSMSDWDRLMSYFGIASGTGTQGNRATTSVSQPSNPLSSILGGGLIASQIF